MDALTRRTRPRRSAGLSAQAASAQPGGSQPGAVWRRLLDERVDGPALHVDLRRRRLRHAVQRPTTGKEASNGLATIPPLVQRARMISGSSARAQLGRVLLDDSVPLSSDNVRHVKPGVPARSLCVNIAACLQTQNGKTILDQNYAQGSQLEQPDAVARARGRPDLLSLFEPTEMGSSRGCTASTRPRGTWRRSRRRRTTRAAGAARRRRRTRLQTYARTCTSTTAWATCRGACTSSAWSAWSTPLRLM